MVTITCLYKVKSYYLIIRIRGDINMIGIARKISRKKPAEILLLWIDSNSCSFSKFVAISR